MTNATRKRLAIIGCGSSGLITLKKASEFLPDWDVVAFEKSGSITGCWGKPYPGFISTSTRYTTQFACFPIVDASIDSDGGESRREFFREGEYGEYLERFADHFRLRSHIRLHHQVKSIERENPNRWQLVVKSQQQQEQESFDAVVVCTGLAAKPKLVAAPIPQLTPSELNSHDGLNGIRHKSIVVIGGGESAVDYANRLAAPELENQVHLSLHSGVRVSPRYHPVRGVPSDFLRNRLMLSAHPDIRNRLGKLFVEARIKYQNLFEKLFPSRSTRQSSASRSELKKYWTLQLTLAAKDEVFNMFHNKSDDFLEAVGDGRIKIVGKPTDKTFHSFHAFPTHDSSSNAVHNVEPDLIVPAIGYESTLESLCPDLKLTDFYLGCCHTKDPEMFSVGFARPIIGNIPSISEMQAHLVCQLLGKHVTLPENLEQLQEEELSRIKKRYQKLNHEAVYPVEMFPYCDRLASMVGLSVGRSFADGAGEWVKTRLSPATTMHYFYDDDQIAPFVKNAPTYMPALLIFIILLIKPLDWIYRLFR